VLIPAGPSCLPLTRKEIAMTLETVASTLDALETPCLLLDETRMTRNIARLNALMAGHGVQLRPHLKTPKSIEVARRLMATPQGPAAVSTLQEAEQFAAARPCKRPNSSPLLASRICCMRWACRRRSSTAWWPCDSAAST